MSESQRRTHDDPTPKAVIHKRILEAAAEAPDATVAELAGEVSGASPELVESVLETYGDPGEDGAAEPEPAPPSQPAAPDASPSDDESPVDFKALTEPQQAVLRAIRERPTATQAEIAAALDVSAATVSRRVNAIEGFEWADRAAVIDRIVPASEHTEEAPSMSATDTETDETVRRLEERLDDLEAAIDDPRPGLTLTFEDPGLAARVAHACIGSDRITEAEELRILTQLMGGPTAAPQGTPALDE